MHCLVNDSQDESKLSIHTCQFSLALSTAAFAGKSNVANSNLKYSTQDEVEDVIFKPDDNREFRFFIFGSKETCHRRLMTSYLKSS